MVLEPKKFIDETTRVETPGYWVIDDTPEKGFLDEYDNVLWVYDSMTTTTHTGFPGDSSGVLSGRGVHIH
eukprot:3404481-Amphidinium_carterae.1